MRHSPKRVRHSWPRALAFPLLLVVSAFAAARLSGAAETHPPAAAPRVLLRAHVVWIGTDRVYVAAEDSIALDPGTRLTFQSHGKTVASAEVERVYDGHLLAARQTSGNLAKEKRPERLQVLMAEPEPRAPTRLRVGIPEGGRSNLVVSCDVATLHLPPAPGGYRVGAVSAREFTLVRESPGAAGAPWPDTLQVVRFGESSDEEIALERGEIEVGVFWPGELSSGMRARPTWQDFMLGTRARGALAVADEPATLPPSAPSAAAVAAPAMAALNRERFRGDLDPCSPADSLASEHVRFHVDTAIPGHAELERLLNGYAGTTAAPTRTVRVFEADGSASLSPAAANCVLRVRCPVLCAPERRAYVSALGAASFAELPECASGAAHP